MRVHVPAPRPREAGDFPVHANPGSDGKPFAIIRLSEDYQTEICLDSLDDADRLVRAAMLARQMLEAIIAREPHPFNGGVPQSAGWCGTCGLSHADRIHADAGTGAAR
jgi:hypothetical protein